MATVCCSHLSLQPSPGTVVLFDDVWMPLYCQLVSCSMFSALLLYLRVFYSVWGVFRGPNR